MNRKKFIEELAFLLQDIEDAEREEAMQYYEDYFDEAGPENEQQVINDLGSPERVAAIIKAGLDNQFDQDIEYSEKGMDNSNYKQSREIIDAKIISEEETAADDNNDYQNNKRHKNNFRGNSDRNRILLIFIIIGAVFLALPVGGGILGLGLGFFWSCIWPWSWYFVWWSRLFDWCDSLLCQSIYDYCSVSRRRIDYHGGRMCFNCFSIRLFLVS